MQTNEQGKQTDKNHNQDESSPQRMLAKMAMDRAKRLWEIGEKDQAIKDIREAYQNAPDLAFGAFLQALKILGDEKNRAGDIQGARIAWQEAYDISGKEEFRQKLGQTSQTFVNREPPSEIERSVTSIRKCSNCQKELSPGWTICPYCGANLQGESVRKVENQVVQARASINSNMDVHVDDVPQIQTPTHEADEGTPKIKRGGCLNAFLIYSIIGNSLAVIFILAMAVYNPDGNSSPEWIFFLTLLFQVVVVISLIGIFRWSKNAVIIYFVLCSLVLIANLISGQFLYSVQSFVSIMLMYSLLKPYWEQLN